jgi:hypothetical protein
MSLPSAIVSGLGYAESRLQLLCVQDASSLDTVVWGLERCEEIAAATFNLSNEKRRTLDFVLDHLARHAPVRRQRGGDHGLLIVVPTMGWCRIRIRPATRRTVGSCTPSWRSPPAKAPHARAVASDASPNPARPAATRAAIWAMFHSTGAT